MGTASVIVGGSSGKHFLRPYTTVMKTPVVLIVILGVITSSAVAQTTDLNVTSNESNYTEVPVEEPVMEPEALPMDFSGAMAASLVYAAAPESSVEEAKDEVPAQQPNADAVVTPETARAV